MFGENIVTYKLLLLIITHNRLVLRICKSQDDTPSNDSLIIVPLMNPYHNYADQNYSYFWQ